MIEYKCPLCKQPVSEDLYGKITGIWKERRKAEQQFKEREKELVRQQREDKKQLIAEKKKLKTEQKETIDKKLTQKTEKFEKELKKIEREKNRIKEQSDKKIAIAIRSAERRAKREINKDIKEKMQETIKKQIERATSKTQKSLIQATRTIESTKKQMGTLQKQSLKQQEKIKNLETQLKNQTTPQIEGLLYEGTLLDVLKKEFPSDRFDHPGKGGDIIQYIIHKNQESGMIVYECKRVSQWQTAHLEQAAKAKLQRNADYAILVTNMSKKGAIGVYIQRGVIVVPPGGVIAMASILREQIIRIAQLKLSSDEREKAIKKTLEYLQGPEFKNSMEVIIRKTEEM